MVVSGLYEEEIPLINNKFRISNINYIKNEGEKTHNGKGTLDINNLKGNIQKGQVFLNNEKQISTLY